MYKQKAYAERQDVFGQAMTLSKSGNSRDAIPLFQQTIREQPYWGLGYLSLARCYQATHQHVLAVQTYGEAIKRKLDLLKTYVGLARCYEEMNQLDDAKKTYETVMALFPNDPTLLLSLTRFYQKIGQYQAALPLFEKLRKTNPTDVTILLSLARCYEDMQQFALALAIFKELYNKDNTNLDVGIGLAVCYEQMGDFEAALKILTQLKRQYPKDKKVLIISARFYQACERYSEALVIYEEYQTLYPSDASMLIGSARCYEAMGQFSEALRVYERLDAHHTTDKKILLSYAGCFQTMSDYRQALAIYKKLDIHYPQDKSILLGLARCYHELDQPTDALEQFEQLKQRYPHDKAILISVARHYQAVGRFAEALALLEKQRKQTPNDKSLLLAQAGCYQADGQYETAVSLYHTLQQQHPHDKTVALNVAHCYEEMGQYEAAFQCYGPFAELKNDKTVQLNIAHYYEKVSQYDVAFQMYESLKKLFPQDKTISLNEARCYQLMGQYDTALTLFKNLAEHYPHDQMLLLGYARCLQAMGQYDRAFAIYHEIYQLDPKNKAAQLSHAQACEAAGQFEAAFNIYRTLQEHYPHNKTLLLSVARYYEAVGEYEAAFHVYEKLKVIYPLDKQVVLSLSRCYQTIGDFETSRVILQQRLELDVKDKLLRLALARCYQYMKQYEAALDVLESLAHDYPNDKTTLLSLTRCYEEMRYFDKAGDVYTQLNKLYAKDTLVQLAVAHYLAKTGDRYQAIEQLNTLIKRAPYYIDAYLALAKFYQQHYKHELAIATLESLCERQPYCVLAKRQLAKCYTTVRDTATVLTYYQQLVENFPYEKAIYLDYLQWLIETNNPSEALAVYTRCEKQFASDSLFLEDATTIAQSVFTYQHDQVVSKNVDSCLFGSSQAQITLPSEIIAIMGIIEQEGYSVYVYGGCVRDSLLGKPVKDFDLKTNAPQAILEKLLPGCRKSMYVENLYTFKVQNLVLDINHSPLIINEHAKTLDFTVNTFYCDRQGHIVYSLPTSWQDLQAKVIHPIGDLSRLITDPIKMLRAVYLSAKLNFAMDSAMSSFIQQHAQSILAINQVRLAKEFPKLFLRGYARQSYTQLQSMHLLELLFPVLARYSTRYEKWLIQQLTLTDQRASFGQTLSINYIYALFLLNMVIVVIETGAADTIPHGMKHIDGIVDQVMEHSQLSALLQERQMDVIKRLLMIFSHQYLLNPTSTLYCSMENLPDNQVSAPVMLEKIALSSFINTVKRSPLASELPPLAQTSASPALLETIQTLPLKTDVKTPASVATTSSDVPKKVSKATSGKPVTLTLFDSKNPFQQLEHEEVSPGEVEGNVTFRRTKETAHVPKIKLHERPIDHRVYALELLTKAIPKSILIKTADIIQAQALLESSFAKARIKAALPAEKEEEIEALINQAIYQRSWWDYTSFANWSSLFHCENYGIYFNEQINANALTVLKVREILQRTMHHPKPHQH